MKIAAKIYVAALTAMLGTSFAPASWAQEALTEPGPIVTSVPGPSSEGVSLTEPSAAPAPKKASAAKPSASSSGGVPETVRNVVERLNAETQDVTLEDLNAAREAVVKLDVLIDIEKRLNDLSKLRQERQFGSATSSVAAALPASALGAPPPLAGAADFSAEPAAPLAASFSTHAVSFPSVGGMASSVSAVEVVLISGAAGSYVATLKENGAVKSVRAGDKLSDGSKVVSISQSGVALSKDGSRKTIQVKDVAKVFGKK